MNFINEMIDPAISGAIGWAIVHSIWQGAAVAILLGTALVFLTDKNARLRYLLSVGALLILTAFSIKTFAYYYSQYSNKNAQEFSYTNLTFEKNAEEVTQLSGLINEENSALSNIYYEFKSYFDEHLQLIVLIYLTGLIFLTLKLMGGLLLTLRLRKVRVSHPGKNFQIIVSSIAGKLGIRRKIEILESKLVNIPVTIGHFKPAILMPLGTLTGIPTLQLEAIFAHELAHIRRADYLINIFQSVIEILFFFNPSVWWISGIIRDERENICDDLAVDVCGESLNLVKALVSVSEINYSNKNLVMAAIGNKNKLYRRINRMTGENKIKSNASKMFAVSFVLIAFLSFGFYACGVSNGENYGSDQNINSSFNYELNENSNQIEQDDIVFVNQDNSDSEKDEKTYVFTKSWKGERSRWKVVISDDKITELHKNDKIVPTSDYHIYEDMIFEAVKDFEDEVAELDISLKELDLNLAELRERLSEMDLKISEETLDSIRKSNKKLSQSFNSKEFKESMKHMREELKNLKINPPKIDWDREQFEREMEEFRESMKNMKIEMEFDSEEFAREMKKLAESLENIKVDIPKIHIPKIEIPDIEIDLSGLEESMKELRENMSNLDIDMTELKKEMKIMSDFLKELKREMVNDGLVNKYEKIDHLELNEDSMYLNYDKVPDYLFEKYREIYKKHYGKYPNKDNKFSILN